MKQADRFLLPTWLAKQAATSFTFQVLQCSTDL